MVFSSISSSLSFFLDFLWLPVRDSGTALTELEGSPTSSVRRNRDHLHLQLQLLRGTLRVRHQLSADSAYEPLRHSRCL